LEPVGRAEFNSDAAAAFGRGDDRHDDRGRSSGGGFDYAAASAFGGKRRAKYDDAPPPRANVAPPALRNNQLGNLLNEIMPVGDKEDQWTTSALRYKKKIVSPPTVITSMDIAFPALCAWDDSDSKKSTPAGSTKTTPSSGSTKSTFADLMRKRVAEEEMDATLHQNNADMEALERQKNVVSLGPRIHMRRTGYNSYGGGGGEGIDGSDDNDDVAASDYSYKRNGRFKSRMPADHELDVDGNINCDAAYASDQDQGSS
jgi:hypothetical protein